MENIEKITNHDTLQHIMKVRDLLDTIIIQLIKRAENHDKSKLEEPELSVFVKYTPKLAKTTYGSDEYKQYLREMQVGLDHHYENNRHHPEFHGSRGVYEMTLIDIVEMLCDWKAATMRHDDGDMSKSIRINQKRFFISDQLTSILRNTAKMWEVIK